MLKVEKEYEIKNRAYKFGLRLVLLIQELEFKTTTKVIGDQLLRAATSIGANIIEAKAASSKKDFIRFYEYALKSSNETKYWLCLCRDASIFETGVSEELLKEAIEIANVIAKIILKTKENSKRK